MHSAHCKRIPQQAKIRFVAESTTVLLFLDLFCCFGFHRQIPKKLYCSKLLELVEAATVFRNHEIQCNLWNSETNKNCKLNPQIATGIGKL